MIKKIPVVFLPGHMCDQRLFGAQIEAVSKIAETKFYPLDKGASMATYAQQVLLAEPANMILLGLSMGGILAMEILRLAPHRVEALVLMDTNPLPEADDVRLVRDGFIERVKNGELEAVMRDELKPGYLVQNENRNQVLELCMQMGLNLGPEIFVNQSHAIQSRRDQSETLANCKVPALVLCGEADRLCPLERHQLMAKLIHHSQLEVIPGAGHLPTLEQADLTSQLLVDWLEKFYRPD